jgi:hypothetical protein
MEDLKKYCASIHKLIEPIMDADGINQVCRVFQSPSGIGSTLLIDLLNFPLYETKLWKWELDKNLNINFEELGFGEKLEMIDKNNFNKNFSADYNKIFRD